MNKMIALALCTSAVIALPTAAGARDRNHGGRRDGGRHNQSYQYDRQPSYGYANRYSYPRSSYSYGYSYGGGYPAYGYNGGYGAYGGYSPYGYGGYSPYGYGYGAYSPYGYGYGSPYGYGGYGYRCGNPAAGAAVGGLAGAVIGSEIADSGRHRYYYRHNGDRAAGAIVGGALGAVVGGVLTSSNC